MESMVQEASSPLHLRHSGGQRNLPPLAGGRPPPCECLELLHAWGLVQFGVGWQPSIELSRKLLWTLLSHPNSFHESLGCFPRRFHELSGFLTRALLGGFGATPMLLAMTCAV